MRTDTVFYQLFQLLPGTLFEIIGLPNRAKDYEFTSEEVKETAFRIDGLLKSNRESRPIYFTEVQFQPKEDFYSKFFAEIFVYLHRNQSNQDWRGVALFARKSFEPKMQKRYKELLNNKRVRRIYLDKLSISENSSLGLKAIGLIVQGQQSAQETVELTRDLISEAKEELEDDVLAEAVVELMKTIVVYKLRRRFESENKPRLFKAWMKSELRLQSPIKKVKKGCHFSTFNVTILS